MRLFLLVLLCLAVPGVAGAAPVSAGEVFTGGVGVALLLFSIFLALLWTLVPFMILDIRKYAKRVKEIAETMDRDSALSMHAELQATEERKAQLQASQAMLAELKRLNATLGGAQIDRE